MERHGNGIARRALWIYVAATIPLGIFVHIVGEAAALGKNPAALAAAPLHWYLGILGVLALAAACCAVARIPRNDRRRQFALLVRALPFGGRGMRFAALSAGLQLAFFLVTECAERCPFGRGDIWLGLLAALLAAFFGAAVIRAVRARIDRIVTVLLDTAVALESAHAVWRAIEFTPCIPYFAYLPSRGSRPPPLAPIR